jgi:hypothetical protein
MQQKSLTFDALISGFTLRASLIALSSLIFIARPAHRESTFIAGNKELSIHCNFHLILTNLTHLSTQFFHRLNLKR